MGNRQDSDSNEEEEEEEEEEGDPPPVVTLPSGLRMTVNTRTRQIHIMSPADAEDEGEPFMEEVTMPPLQLLTRILGGPRHFALSERDNINVGDPTPVDEGSRLREQIKYDTGQLQVTNTNIYHQVQKHQHMPDTPSLGQRVSTTKDMLPNHPCLADIFDSRVFCGIYNDDGTMFLSACQSHKLYLYDTRGGRFKRRFETSCEHVGWGIMDAVFSPDQQCFAYSTWSQYVNLCSVYGEEEPYTPLDLKPDHDRRFCAFAIDFSNDNKEIIASSNDGNLYLYNREVADRTLKIEAHEDDANAVAFADASSQLIYSGGDDGICRVWDRRLTSQLNPRPVGSFAGHKDGIVYIDSKGLLQSITSCRFRSPLLVGVPQSFYALLVLRRTTLASSPDLPQLFVACSTEKQGDGRYLITNSKDQSIKLWDVRKFSSEEGIQATLDKVKHQGWDYRYQSVPKEMRSAVLQNIPGDTSVTTYVGHWIKHTLMRCRFSPMATTGQSYIYAACAKGRVIIYDLLTARVVRTLTAPSCTHRTRRKGLDVLAWDNSLIITTVRDVYWHPQDPGVIVAATWDGYLQMWSYNKRKNYVKERHARRLFDLW